jgi:chromosome segregation ATPase
MESEFDNMFYSKKYLEEQLLIVSKSEADINKLQEQNENLNEKLNFVIADRDNIVEEYTKIIKQYSAKVNDIEIAINHNAGNQNYDEDITFYYNKVSELENVILELKYFLKTTKDELSALQSELEVKETIIADITNQNNELSNKIENLEGLSISINDGMSEDIFVVANDLSNKSSDHNISELLTENERLLDIISDLNSQLASSKSGYKCIISDNNKLINENQSLQTELQKIDKLTSAFEKLQTTNVEQNETIKKLNEELKECKKRIYDENSLFAPSNIEATKLINAQGIVGVSQDFAKKNDEAIYEYKDKLNKTNTDLEKVISENKLLNITIANLRDELSKAYKNSDKSAIIGQSSKPKQKTARQSNSNNNAELVNKIESFLSKLEDRL